MEYLMGYACFRDWLCSHRQKSGLTQAQVAQRTQALADGSGNQDDYVSQSYVAKLESRIPSRDRREPDAKLYNVSTRKVRALGMAMGLSDQDILEGLALAAGISFRRGSEPSTQEMPPEITGEVAGVIRFLMMERDLRARERDQAQRTADRLQQENSTLRQRLRSLEEQVR